jgi:protein SCO1
MLRLLLMLLLLTPLAGPPPSRLAVIRNAPGFTLVNQAGKEVKLADCKGKVVLVSFIFTTCNGSCPATTHRMANIQQELEHAGRWNTDKVQFLSISLDPARDTPDALARYMKLYDISGNGWSFLTGPPPDVAAAIAAWGMWVKPADNGQLDHPSRIFLLDRQMRIREIYNTELLKVEDVCADIRELTDS